MTTLNLSSRFWLSRSLIKPKVDQPQAVVPRVTGQTTKGGQCNSAAFGELGTSRLFSAGLAENSGNAVLAVELLLLHPLFTHSRSRKHRPDLDKSPQRDNSRDFESRGRIASAIQKSRRPTSFFTQEVGPVQGIGPITRIWQSVCCGSRAYGRIKRMRTPSPDAFFQQN